MALETVWLNDRKPVDGFITAQIMDGDRVVSTFKGRTPDEVADKVLDSAARAQEKIRELRVGRTPDKSALPAPIQPKPLTADDRFRIGTQMLDPDKTPEAIEELLTTSVGATPARIGEMLKDQDQRSREAYYKAEAEAFVAAHPDYFADPERVNQQKLFAALQNKGYDLTRNNLSLVYDELDAQGLLIKAPDTSHPEPGTHVDPNTTQEPNPPRTRPRTVSATGLRDANTSATRPPAAPKPSLTREQVDAMPRAEYERKIRDKTFRDQVDALPR